MPEHRRVEVKENDCWQPSSMASLRQGDIFRLFEYETNELIGGDELIAACDAYEVINENNVQTWAVKVDAST